jgi:hypothetical protein
MAEQKDMNQVFASMVVACLLPYFCFEAEKDLELRGIRDATGWKRLPLLSSDTPLPAGRELWY